MQSFLDGSNGSWGLFVLHNPVEEVKMIEKNGVKEMQGYDPYEVQ